MSRNSAKPASEKTVAKKIAPVKVGIKKPAKKKSDRRVTRTRNILGDAIIQLMQEKPFEQITVQHVLDRAGVSRSTFYTHYSDKNDLFLGDVDDFWEMMSTMLTRRGEKSNRVAPVRELFAHVAEVRDFYSAVVTAGKFHEVMDLGQEHFARAIEARLKEMTQARALVPGRRAALAHMFAGALFSSMAWWINHGTKETPAHMDDLYHEMVWASVGGVGESRK